MILSIKGLQVPPVCMVGECHLNTMDTAGISYMNIDTAGLLYMNIDTAGILYMNIDTAGILYSPCYVRRREFRCH